MSWYDGVLDAQPWLEDLVNAVGASPEDGPALDAVAVRLLAACVIGWVIGAVYRRTFTGVRFSPTLPDTHLLLALGGALIWLVVGNSLVRAFGLAGTIGLIRYRTVVRDPKDTTILLFSMVMGMACGLGQVRLALVGTGFVLLALAYLHVTHRRRLAEQRKRGGDLLSLLGDDGESDESRPPDGR